MTGARGGGDDGGCWKRVCAMAIEVDYGCGVALCNGSVALADLVVVVSMTWKGEG